LDGDPQTIPGWQNRVFANIIRPIIPQRFEIMTVQAAFSPFHLPSFKDLFRRDEQDELESENLEEHSSSSMSTLREEVSSWIPLLEPRYKTQPVPRVLKLPEPEPKEEPTRHVEEPEEVQESEESNEVPSEIRESGRETTATGRAGSSQSAVLEEPSTSHNDTVSESATNFTLTEQETEDNEEAPPEQKIVTTKEVEDEVVVKAEKEVQLREYSTPEPNEHAPPHVDDDERPPEPHEQSKTINGHQKGTTKSVQRWDEEEDSTLSPTLGPVDLMDHRRFTFPKQTEVKPTLVPIPPFAISCVHSSLIVAATFTALTPLSIVKPQQSSTSGYHHQPPATVTTTMHIKQITISNFRSFRQQPEIHPFAATTNCVVGRNGSGKSNLFDAVQFVLLAPRFATLRSDERQALLHEGSGSAAVNAFVEVVFDNSDNRFSMENSDEVVLRRTIGTKKDEFFLQRKRATKQEVQSLLEGAGFSKSNPYFMVQQGKIQSICVMSDTERLRLLQQVAGTTLYEDKKAESLVKMEENSQSIEKINSILSDIDNRLNELQGEKEELTAYQKLDRERKALEYTLYDKELRKARTVLDSVEHNRVDHLKEQGAIYERVKQTHDQIQSAEGNQKVKIEKLKRILLNRTQMESTKTESLTLKTKLGLQCQELEDQLTLMNDTAKRNEKELAQLEKEIGSTQESFEEKNSSLKEEEDSLRKMQSERDQAARTADGLYSRQGRGKQYKSKKQRDASLRKEIQEIQAQKSAKEQEMKQQQDSLANIRRQADTNRESIGKKQQEVQEKQQTLQMLHKRVEEMQKKRIQLMDVRKDAFKKRESANESLADLRELRSQTKSNMYRSMPRATSMGLRNLQSVVEEEGLIVGEQYFGMVMENMTLKDPKFQTAVERSAQNALLHVIVDTDATAARLMKRLEQGRLGRVTFLPLNKLRVNRNTRYPQSNAVAPILQTCIDYDPKVETAMLHVFDRKLLARTTEDANEWAEKARMDAVTMEGDVSTRRGAMSGGYIEEKKSRLKAFNDKLKAEKDHRATADECRRADANADKADREVRKIVEEINKLQHKESQISLMIQTLDSDQTQTQTQIGQNKKQADRLESQIVPVLEQEIKSFDFDIARLEEEIGTELTQTLSDEDRAMLARLTQEKEDLDEKISTQQETVDEIRSERNRLESHLENNLYKRRSELAQGGNEADALTGSTSSKLLHDQKIRQLEERRLELREATRELEDLENKLQEIRKTEEDLKNEVVEGKNDMEKLRNLDIKYARNLEESKRKGESLLGKKSLNIGRRDNYMRKIQELGSLPPDSELRVYRNKNIDALERSLESVNKKLKKYSHVNKKAFDQYVNFSEKRESLVDRKDELDRGADKVKELVESLDRKKDEAINRTFRGVSKHFTDVFKELVPLGEGELIMRTAIDDQLGGGDDDDDDDMDTDDEGPSQKSKGYNPDNPDVSLYRAVGVKVRFSAVGENYMMSQLSGGQKALVALALIFAIQRCDPAPFYIFDELDQALDSTYRSSVANLIQRQANNQDNPAQFICSTFRPELVKIAKNCYGISHQNKVSSIHYLPKTDALKFIRNLMAEEEAVGESATTGRASMRSSGARKRKSTTAPEEEDDGGSTLAEESQAASTQGLQTQPA
ncbi:MAG: hypothetical protein SGILL_003759, partial [Bacillariaceae sp.]